jgi:arylsulfatase A-like enzyme
MARFTSLNLSWANVSNTPFRFYKDYSHNGGIATPLIINWPSTIKEKNRVSRSRGHFVDILPTILDITGADYPREYNGQKILPYDGKSLLPEILDGKDLDNSRPLFFQWGPDQALMKDNWKIVRYNSGPWELYNMDNDKTETNNLVEQEQEVAKDLIKKHEQWMLEMSQYLYENE